MLRLLLLEGAVIVERQRPGVAGVLKADAPIAILDDEAREGIEQPAGLAQADRGSLIQLAAQVEQGRMIRVRERHGAALQRTLRDGLGGGARRGRLFRRRRCLSPWRQAAAGPGLGVQHLAQRRGLLGARPGEGRGRHPCGSRVRRPAGAGRQ